MTIKEIRIVAVLSRAEMSKEFEIPIRTLENWESGIRKPPDWAEKMITERLKSMKKRFVHTRKFISNGRDIPFTFARHEEKYGYYPRSI